MSSKCHNGQTLWVVLEIVVFITQVPFIQVGTQGVEFSPCHAKADANFNDLDEIKHV